MFLRSYDDSVRILTVYGNIYRGDYFYELNKSSLSLKTTHITFGETRYILNKPKYDTKLSAADYPRVRNNDLLRFDLKQKKPVWSTATSLMIQLIKRRKKEKERTFSENCFPDLVD
jgi:hypothetical protein